MKKIIFIALLILMVTAYGKTEENPIIKDEYQGRKLEIILPKSYNDNPRRYPVMYVMDGHDISDKDLGLTQKYYELSDQNNIEEMIVVGVHSDEENNRREREYIPFYVDELEFVLKKEEITKDKINNECVRFTDFFVNGVVDYIDDKYKTLTDKRARAVMGISHGAGFAMWVGFNRSDKFENVIAISPSIWLWKEQMENMKPKIQEARENGLKIWIDSGNGEFGPEVRYFLKQIVDDGYKYGEDIIYYEVFGAGHSWQYFRERIGMPFIFFDMNFKSEVFTDAKVKGVEFYKEYTDSWFFKKGFLYFNPVIELERGLKFSAMTLAEYKMEEENIGFEIDNRGEIKYKDKTYYQKAVVVEKYKEYQKREEIDMAEAEKEFRNLGLKREKW